VRAEYRLNVRAKCPVDQSVLDSYAITVISQSVIKVEDILAFFDSQKDAAIFQEALTELAARTLGAKVISKGIHSGVEVTCEC